MSFLQTPDALSGWVFLYSLLPFVLQRLECSSTNPFYGIGAISQAFGDGGSEPSGLTEIFSGPGKNTAVPPGHMTSRITNLRLLFVLPAHKG